MTLFILQLQTDVIWDASVERLEQSRLFLNTLLCCWCSGSGSSGVFSLTCFFCFLCQVEINWGLSHSGSTGPGSPWKENTTWWTRTPRCWRSRWSAGATWERPPSSVSVENPFFSSWHHDIMHFWNLLALRWALNWIYLIHLSSLDLVHSLSIVLNSLLVLLSYRRVFVALSAVVSISLITF